jgi:hypothetical protein
MKRINLLVYYRQNRDKLDYHDKLNNFLYGVMFSAGFFGFITAIGIHMIPTVRSTRTAGAEIRQLYPVNIYFLFATFACLMCFWGAGLLHGSMLRQQLIRDLLEEQGVVSTARPVTIGIYLFESLVGAAVGGLMAFLFLLVTLVP